MRDLCKVTGKPKLEACNTNKHAFKRAFKVSYQRGRMSSVHHLARSDAQDRAVPTASALILFTKTAPGECLLTSCLCAKHMQNRHPSTVRSLCVDVRQNKRTDSRRRENKR